MDFVNETLLINHCKNINQCHSIRYNILEFVMSLSLDFL